MKQSVFLLIALVCLPPIVAVNPAWELSAHSAGEPAVRQIAVTFDDLPAAQALRYDAQTLKSMTAKLLKALATHGVPAIGFVNESGLYRKGEVDERIEILRMWLEAGHELGNHTFSHVAINQTPVLQYQEDLIRGETVTRLLLREKGKTLSYFRHTQLRTGPTLEYKRALDQFLAGRGYIVAPVTIDNQDYMFASVYARALERRDKVTMKRVTDAYIPYMEGVFDFFEKLSVDFLGYEVKQTLLLHVNQLNADAFEELARMFKKRGYRFVTLGKALEDRAYRLPDAQSARGISWLHRWMLAKGMQMRDEPREPEFITRLFNADSSR